MDFSFRFAYDFARVCAYISDFQSLSRDILYICANCKVIIFNFLLLYIRVFFFAYIS